MKFVKIPAGKFVIGSPENEPGRFNDEKQREVTVKSFEISDAPVTQKEWEEVVGNNPSHFKGGNNPVENVNYNDVQEFLVKTKNKYRLPTEEEWEYACRAGTKSAYFFGDDPSKLDRYAWFSANSDGRTHIVKTKEPNPWGLYDMHGNVWEWTSSLYEASGSYRVIRGGSWYGLAQYARSALRFSYGVPGSRGPDVGFRLVRMPRNALRSNPLTLSRKDR
jgi:formylglycine-generating enzyme required for sulfatase activity